MKRSRQQRRPGKVWFQARSLILAAMAGATFAYFSDPVKGHSRRTVLSDQARSVFHRRLRRLERQARYLACKARGKVEESLHVHVPDNSDPDDVTLRDRIESELFRDRAVPKGDLNINVAQGVVELRGQVDHASDVDEIQDKVGHIEGVTIIHNYLHVAGVPAPNKARVMAVR
jgi:osmotically-inducible protein OsmY